MNNRYKNLFRLPEPLVSKVGARIMSLSDPFSKMSKSEHADKGCIYLLDTPEAAHKKIMSAITDSLGTGHFDPEKQPGVSNLIQIFSSLNDDKPYDEIEREFAGKGYGVFKRAVAESVCATLEVIQERYHNIIKTGTLDDVLQDGAQKAKPLAAAKLDQVQRALGMEIHM